MLSQEHRPKNRSNKSINSTFLPIETTFQELSIKGREKKRVYTTLCLISQCCVNVIYHSCHEQRSQNNCIHLTEIRNKSAKSLEKCLTPPQWKIHFDLVGGKNQHNKSEFRFLSRRELKIYSTSEGLRCAAREMKVFRISGCIKYERFHFITSGFQCNKSTPSNLQQLWRKKFIIFIIFPEWNFTALRSCFSIFTVEWDAQT